MGDMGPMGFGIRDSGFFRISDFGLRTSSVVFPLQHPFARDPVLHLAGRLLANFFTESLPRQKKQPIPNLALRIIEPLAPRHFANERRGDRDFFAAIKLEQTFVTDLLFAFHVLRGAIGCD